MFVALPMYDHPGVRAEREAFWAIVRDQLRSVGIDAPEGFEHSDDLFGQWRHPDLLLGQTCGLPFRLELHRKVSLVGSLDYGLKDTPPGYYHSVFVVRARDPRNRLEEFGGATLAYNDGLSHSGWATAAFAPVQFKVGPCTGSHRESTRAVADGTAEIAAIDAVSWRLIAAHTNLTDTLKIVGRSACTPGQALITAFPEAVPALQDAIRLGIDTLEPRQRAALGLRKLVQIPPNLYLDVPNPPSPKAYSGQNATA